MYRAVIQKDISFVVMEPSIRILVGDTVVAIVETGAGLTKA